MRTAPALLASAFLFLAAATPLALPGIAQAQAASELNLALFAQTRKTLFLQAGTQRFTAEAPVDMCFLDRTKPVEQAIFANFKALTPPDSFLMAVFVGCDQLAGLPGIADMPFLQRFGTITWLNPAVGEKVAQNPDEFLSRAKPLLADRVSQYYLSAFRSRDPLLRSGGYQNFRPVWDALDEGALPELTLPDDVIRTNYTLSATTTAKFRVTGVPWTMTGVDVMTLVRGVPLQLTLARTSDKEDPAMADDMLAMLDEVAESMAFLNTP